jgi:hypothetical protein
MNEQKLREAAASCYEASKEHKQKQRGPFADTPMGRSLEHGHSMASIAYQNAWQWVRDALGVPVTKEELEELVHG